MDWGATTPPRARAYGTNASTSESCCSRFFLLAVAAIAPFGWNYLQSYESTDDAQIDGHIDPLSSRIDGTVVRVYPEDDDRVTKGELLVEIDPRDYNVALGAGEGAPGIGARPACFREAGLRRGSRQRSRSGGDEFQVAKRRPQIRDPARHSESSPRNSTTSILPLRELMRRRLTPPAKPQVRLWRRLPRGRPIPMPRRRLSIRPYST